MLLGYSASGQGGQDRAERLFDEAVGVDVPERTFSANRSIEARAVFRRGDRPRALRILRSHVEELLDTDNMHGTCATSVEFVTMMAKIKRLPEAAHMLRYLETTGMLDIPVWATQVAEARTTIATTVEAPRLDDRQALEYMRQILRQL